MDREEENKLFDATREAVRYLFPADLDDCELYHREAILDELDKDEPDTRWIEYNEICLSACFFEQRDREKYPWKKREYKKCL